ncbi:MAG: glycosyltransferase family 4 protein [Promethearchaeota archaeon]|nr:MAG: glycosyltransferase family 4 protein [Candidatus Lokiarchaeota archaeon]
MRILFFGTYFQFRGKETYVSDEIDAVSYKYPNIEYLIYTVGPFNKKNSLIRYSKKILWIRRKDLKSIKILLLFLKEIIKIFTKFKPDVIHSIYVKESLIMGVIGKIFGVPSVFHSRGMDFNYYPFKSLKSNILARIAAKLNNVILTVSKVMKYDSRKLNIAQKKVISLYDGIDFSLFNLSDKERSLNRKHLEILHVGRFNPEKRQELIIEACKKLRDNGLNFHLTITGYGQLENHLKNLIRKYQLESKVSMIGYTDHDKVPEIMKKADIYIQPSLSEGMPISVLEAMSMELPVILTRVGGMTELILKRGGVLIEINNISQLYDAIVYYINNPNIIRVDGIRNRKFIKENFNWEVHAKELYKIYNKLSKRS